MKNIKILDCTLRDGGHVNYWNFGEDTILSIITNLIKSKVDIIELGLVKHIEHNIDLSLKPKLSLFENTVKDLKRLSHQQFTIMVRPDWVNKDIFYTEKNRKIINGIRFAFYPDSLNQVLDHAEKAKENGFDIYFNPVAISTYTNIQIIEIINKLLICNPKAFSIVDTFGALNLSRLKEIYQIFDNELPINIEIGIHLHENKSLARFLAKEFFIFRNPKRNSIIDASLLGMGRMPGNLCIEQLINDIDQNHESYDLNPIYKVIDKEIAPIKKVNTWGYSPEYMISSNYNINRNYAEYFLSKKIPLDQYEKAFEYISLNQNNSPKFSKDLAEKSLEIISIKKKE